MPRKRRRERGRLGALDLEQEMELEIGPDHRQSSFVDDEARAEMWFGHREELLAEGPAGQRPWGWWRYESGLKPGERPQDEVAWLRKQGLLTPFEEAELENRRRLREEAPATIVDRHPGGAA